MKAKKPLLLAVLILALLSVALIVPAVASGQGKPEAPGDNKPVAWVNWGVDSAQSVVPDFFIQVLGVVTVKQLMSTDTVGKTEQHLILRLPGEKPVNNVGKAREFENLELQDGLASYFYDDLEFNEVLQDGEGNLLPIPMPFPGKVAVVYPIYEPQNSDDGSLPMKWILFDGGEPGFDSNGFPVDWVVLYEWNSDELSYDFTLVGPGGSNVQIHITDDYDNPLL